MSRSVEIHALTVAHATMKGDVHIEPTGPRELTVPFGTPVRLLVEYEFHDATSDRDDYRIAFHTFLGDLDSKHTEAIMKDRPFVADEGSGALEHIYTALPSGRYELRFDVEVAGRRRRWATGKVQAEAADHVQGKIALTVL